MRRLLLFLLFLGLLAAGAYYGAVRYVAPKEELTLDYKPFDLAGKVLQMVEERRLTLVISDEELNSLLVSRLAAEPAPHPDVRITGARFTREAELLHADVNLVIRERWKAGVRFDYRLEWDKPYLQARFEQATIRGNSLPQGLLSIPDVSVQIEELLPPLVGIKVIDLSGKDIAVAFQVQLGK